jgi:D-arabinose 1-dehydrogenase-like Zn-dependent alcohol dehydrogenase
MRAVLLTAPGKLELREVHDPVIGPYDALCESVYGAVCAGTDRHLVDGSFPWPAVCPAILGHETVGRVVRIGAQVRSLRPGDMVVRVGAPASPRGDYQISWGGWASLTIAQDHRAMRADGLPEADWQGSRSTLPVPDGIDPAVAPLFITWRETLSTLRRCGVGPGMRVLVIGSGGNGLAFAAHARHLGAALVAMAGSAVRADAARLAGAQIIADYRQTVAWDRLAAAAPTGFDLVVDTLGRASTAARALPLLALDGGYLAYGLDELGKFEPDRRLARGPFVQLPAAYDEAEVHQDVIRLVGAGTLRPEPWYDPRTTISLADVPALFADHGPQAIKPLIRF